jgi:hypothetical protein
MFRKEEESVEVTVPGEGTEGLYWEVEPGEEEEPECTECWLGERLQTELAQLCGALGLLWQKEMDECEAEAREVMICLTGSPEGDEECGGKREAVELMVFVEHVDLARRMLRTECEAHGWKRTVAPTEVEVGEVFDICPGCISCCSCDEEEREAFIRGMVLLGIWSVPEAEQLRATVAERGGVCCVR